MLCLLLPRDISGDAKRTNHFSFFIFQWHFGGAAPRFRTIAKFFVFDVGQNSLSGLHDPTFVGQRFTRMFQRKKICIGFSKRVSGISQSELDRTTLAQTDEPTVGVLEVHRIGYGFQQGGQQKFFKLNLMLGILLVADIPEHHLDANHIAFGAVHGCFPDLRVNELLIGQLMPLDVVVEFARLHDTLIVFHVLFGKLSRKKVEVGFADQLGHSQP